MPESLSVLRRALQGRAPESLRPDWCALDRTFDVVILGGGIHGAGIARAAAASGLDTLLVEMQDWAGGTSSRSSKLFHGGLRYLAQGELSLVRRAQLERDRHLALMPDFVRPLRFRVALPGRSPVTRLKFRAGVALYGILTLGSSRARPFASDPSYDDAWTDDARLVWELVRDARRRGALALNYCRAQGWELENPEAIRVTLRDVLTGKETAVRAGALINATGPWAHTVDPRGDVRLTRGTHVVLRGQPEDGAARLFLSPEDDRVLFLIPYLDGCSLVGTTDLDEPEPIQDPRPRPEEIRYLSTAFRKTFPAWGGWAPVGWMCGLRPLVPGPGSPSSVSREEAVLKHPEGRMWTVVGGKYTGYRDVARRLMGALAGREPENFPLAAGPGSEDPLRAAFVEEDAVLLEDAFFRRTFWGHSGGATEARIALGARHFASRWSLGDGEAAEAAAAFRQQLSMRQRALDLWA